MVGSGGPGQVGEPGLHDCDGGAFVAFVAQPLHDMLGQVGVAVQRGQQVGLQVGRGVEFGDPGGVGQREFGVTVHGVAGGGRPGDGGGGFDGGLGQFRAPGDAGHADPECRELRDRVHGVGVLDGAPVGVFHDLSDDATGLGFVAVVFVGHDHDRHVRQSGLQGGGGAAVSGAHPQVLAVADDGDRH